METKKSSLKKVMKLQLVLFLAIITITNTYAQDNFKIDLVDNNIKIYRQDKLLIDIVSIMFNFVEPDSVILNKVTSNGVVLNLVLEGPDGFHENFPKIVPVTIQYTNNTIHFFAEHETFNHITIRMNDLQEHYYGLIEKLYPHNSTNPDLRGNVIDVDVYSEGSSEYAENYASAYSAFYMSSKGYGSFFDTFARGRYHFAINGITEIYHQTNKLDWYIFYGPTGDKIHKEYYDLIGSPKYVPMWALGPLFWRDQNNGGSEEILNDIKQYTDLKIPLTSCWVDRPYSDGANEWSMMNFNSRFANPEKWIKIINEKYGMQFMTWVGPMTFDDYNFPGLLPNYKNYIDLTNPEALNEFENRLVKYQYSVNVRGHKMDRADESFPFTSQWFEGKSESQSRNKYIYLYSKVIDKFLNKALGKNNFNFARAAFHRSQPFLSAVWGGDSRNNWIGLRGNMANAIRCSFMGFPIWGTDTGGYLGEGKIDETLYIRWLQFAAWNGMFEVKIDGAGARGEDRAPWHCSEQLQNVYRNLSEHRMKFLPYIYSCANTSHTNGVLMKPLAYMYPEDKNTYQIYDEYIFGNSFLVAPVLSESSSREIYLPEGKWHDYNDLNRHFEGPATIIKESDLLTIPVFVKENSIFVTGDVFRGNSRNWLGDLPGEGNLTIHLVPGEENESTQFTYLDYFASDSENVMKLIHRNNKIIFTCGMLTADVSVEILLKTKPLRVLINSRPVDFDFNNSIVKIKLAANTETVLDVEIK